MDNIISNKKAIQILKMWDPFQLGEEHYDTEAADVVAALQGIDDPIQLAKVIQSVYEFSFEHLIPFDECVAISYKLIAVKSEAKCTF